MEIELRMKENCNSMCKRGNQILVSVGFDFQINEFFLFPFPFYNNPNTLVNENGINISFLFSVPIFQKLKPFPNRPLILDNKKN